MSKQDKPVAWRSFDVARQKAYYDELPIQSIQPGAYTHTPLYPPPPPAPPAPEFPALPKPTYRHILHGHAGAPYGDLWSEVSVRAAIAADRAARTALTDEQIDAIAKTTSPTCGADLTYDERRTVWDRAFARAVLAAAQGSKP